jgi:hypothetical protein
VLIGHIRSVGRLIDLSVFAKLRSAKLIESDGLYNIPAVNLPASIRHFTLSGWPGLNNNSTMNHFVHPIPHSQTTQGDVLPSLRELAITHIQSMDLVRVKALVGGYQMEYGKLHPPQTQLEKLVLNYITLPAGEPDHEYEQQIRSILELPGSLTITHLEMAQMPAGDNLATLLPGESTDVS